VTDSLIEVAQAVVDVPSDVVEQKVGEYISWLKDKHHEAIKIAVSDEAAAGDVTAEVDRLIEKLRVTLLGVGYLEDISPKSMDYILSFGERLCMNVVSGAITSLGLKSNAYTGFEAGLITDSSYGRARPLFTRIGDSVNEKLKPVLDEGVIPVVSGFIAANEEGHITTLGRGGSDYTASLLGAALSVDEVQIWTDVDGILSCDPRIVSDARLIDTLSYAEALDLGYFGAKVIHSKMIEPAMECDVAVRVKNTFNPSGEGTLIVSRQQKADKVVKAVALAREVVIINLSGVGMVETPNIAGKVFSTLGDANINVIMISGSSESNLSFVVNKKDAKAAVDLLAEEINREIVEGLSLIEDVAIVCMVGAGMAGAKGIAAKIFTHVSEADVNIIMIAQGSSEVNIAFIVLGSDADKTVKTLHDKFIT
ncbi:MAG: aspartate kinase, partial [Candidatus Altiarchaeales archaeon]|nr:aspartate kinase [Candidatus Altiarchaeales archaeon]